MKQIVDSIVREIMYEGENSEYSQSCSCGCGTCENKDTINKPTSPPALISEGIDYHFKQNIPFTQNIYRPGSENYFKLYNEVRLLCESGLLVLEGEDKFLIETTDIGLWGEVDGKKVPLDFPMLDEQGGDTSWEDGEGNKVTLQDILDMTKNIPQKEYPTEKLAKVVLNWDDNPEEIDRISQVEISKQYPILIMVDEGGEIQWILDGNHRAQKALRAKSKTIPAKLIKPSNLDAKAKKVLLNIPMLDESINEAKKNTKKLNKPMRDSSGGKAYKVYVKDPKTKKIKTVRFGSGGLRAKINDKKARNAFAARHKCAQKKDKTKAGYWSCRLPRYAKLLGLKSTFSGFW